MTLSGKVQLEKELERLLKEERPKVIEAIKEARGHGDLSENADYDAAKERQSFVEARIAEIQSKLSKADVVDTSKINSEVVVFGATVHLLDLETDEKQVYKIVGVDEADVAQKRISVFSPLAKALLRKKVGDVVEFATPKGEKEYEILKLEFV